MVPHELTILPFFWMFGLDQIPPLLQHVCGRCVSSIQSKTGILHGTPSSETATYCFGMASSRQVGSVRLELEDGRPTSLCTVLLCSSNLLDSSNVVLHEPQENGNRNLS